MNLGVLALTLLGAGGVIWAGGMALRGYGWAQVDELRVRGLLDQSFAAMLVGAAIFFIGVGVTIAAQGGQ